MQILHFSDLHFGNSNATFNRYQLASALTDWLNNNQTKTILVISGDVTFRGKREGYRDAKDFFQDIIQKCRIERDNIILCPGNHDIVEGSFSRFDEFSYSLRQDSVFTFEEQNVVRHSIENLYFEVFNTSFHLDRTYGYIDKSIVNNNGSCHPTNDQWIKKIAVTHHHLLGMFKEDTSAIRNSYKLVIYLEKEDFNYLLHGHQHASQNYYIGKKPIEAISARSGNFPQNGYFNAINRYIFNEDYSEMDSSVLLFEQNSDEVTIQEVKR